MDLSLSTSTTGAKSHEFLVSAHGIDDAIPRTLDLSKFTAGTHYDATTKVLFAGIGIAKITASGLYGPYDTTASDGRQTALDSIILDAHLLLKPDGTLSTQIAVAVLRHAHIRLSKLPVAAQRAGGASDLSAATTTGQFEFEA